MIAHRPLLAAAISTSLALVAAAASAPPSAALMSSSAVSAASFTTGTWPLYLHAEPTPPSGDTAAGFGLTMTSASPTATSLYNYDTNCDSATGRRLVAGLGLASESSVCNYVTWRNTAYAAPRTLTGTASLTVFARRTSALLSAPALVAYLRDLDPSTGTYAQLASATSPVAALPSDAFAPLSLSLVVTASVPAGHQVELKLVATGLSNVDLAYDVVTAGSRLTLP